MHAQHQHLLQRQLWFVLLAHSKLAIPGSSPQALVFVKSWSLLVNPASKTEIALIQSMTTIAPSFSLDLER
jgi:hypothetical protein